jgi:hypothetical protein
MTKINIRKEKIASLSLMALLVIFAACAGNGKVAQKETVKTTLESTPILKQDSSRVIVDSLRFM